MENDKFKAIRLKAIGSFVTDNDLAEKFFKELATLSTTCPELCN
jgi:hypothetical protein